MSDLYEQYERALFELKVAREHVADLARRIAAEYAAGERADANAPVHERETET